MSLTLDPTNSVQLLAQFVEVAQKNGVFLLQEANVLQRAINFLLNGSQDPELTVENAKNILIQGVVKGQKGGSYTLQEASVLHQTIVYITEHISDKPKSQTKPMSVSEIEEKEQVETVIETVKNDKSEDDMFDDLSTPIPLINEI